MSNEQQELLSEAYENYCTTLIGSITFSDRGKHFKSDGLEFNSGYPNYVHYSQEEFIIKCKTDPEFSERWGLKIEERELSLEERATIWNNTHNPVGNIYTHNQYDENDIPTKLITITRELSYDERFKIAYKNLELRKKLEAESAMLHYPSGHIKVMDDNNIPTNKTIESYEL